MTDRNFHEVWWIYAPKHHPWGGLRLAHFRKTDDILTVLIVDEADRRPFGEHVWDDIALAEGWIKVARVPIPGSEAVRCAADTHAIIEQMK